MLIQSIIVRQPDGTRVPMPNRSGGETLYHFTGPKDGPHVCDVTDDDHIARFLSIPDGFRLVTQASAGLSLPPVPAGGASDGPKEASAPNPLAEAVAALTAEVEALKIENAALRAAQEGKLAVAVPEAPAAAPEPAEDDGEDAPAPSVAITPPEEPDPELEAARAEFEAEFGRAPNPKTKTDKLRLRVQEAREAKAAAGA
ncbi:MAG: hypothetical protein BWX64_02330 [Acidobacteria bacterium ADurb.Bin051]|nr:MAG: hypothetical protein BWX64_02330 [Acidobacteria bacterium ADurb.Bin051]